MSCGISPNFVHLPRGFGASVVRGEVVASGARELVALGQTKRLRSIDAPSSSQTSMSRRPTSPRRAGPAGFGERARHSWSKDRPP